MKHEIVEKNIGLMIVLIILTISGGFLAEVVPLFFQKEVNECWRTLLRCLAAPASVRPAQRSA